MAATRTALSDLALDDTGNTLRWWTPAEEPAVAYGFCSHCGSSLFWRCTDRPEAISIAAGTLDSPTGLTTTAAVFGAEASDYHRLDPDLTGQARAPGP